MKKIIISLAVLALLAPAVIFAQEPNSKVVSDPNSKTYAGSLPNPVGVTSIGELVTKIVQVVISIGYVVIAFFLIVSGFKFVTAQGSDDKLTEAKQTFYYTLVGALIIIGAQTIVAIVEGIIKGISK
jgi:hypothetical protein